MSRIIKSIKYLTFILFAHSALANNPIQDIISQEEKEQEINDQQQPPDEDEFYDGFLDSYTDYNIENDAYSTSVEKGESAIQNNKSLEKDSLSEHSVNKYNFLFYFLYKLKFQETD